jgi:hypothetical protein
VPVERVDVVLPDQPDPGIGVGQALSQIKLHPKTRVPISRRLLV